MSDLTCFRGDTKSWVITVSVDSVTQSLTGAKLWMTAVRGSAGGTQVFQRTSDPGGGITIDPDQITNRGKAVIKLAPTSTSSLPAYPVTLFYDVQVLFSNGDLLTVLSGDLVVSPDATLEIA